MSEPAAGAVWVDSHCHLYMHGEDPEALLERAAAAGVAWVMCPGVDADSSAEAKRLAARYPGRVQWSAGLHPHDASSLGDEWERLVSLATDADAIGECGLDYYRNLAPPADQRAAFRAQIDLARDLGKPLIVHCRDAFGDVFEMLAAADLGTRAVLHCWTGGSKWTRRFDDLGATFSIAGPLTYLTGDTLRHAARHLPRERTMLETDTPYLTPEPHRAERNEPALLPLTGAVLADVWGVPVDEVAAATSAAAAAVFGKPS
jgi:TatD DNase family protein